MTPAGLAQCSSTRVPRGLSQIKTRTEIGQTSCMEFASSCRCPLVYRAAFSFLDIMVLKPATVSWLIGVHILYLNCINSCGHMGDCQNYGPFLGPYYNTGPNTGPNLGDPKRDHNFDNPPHDFLKHASESPPSPGSCVHLKI